MAHLSHLLTTFTLIPLATALTTCPGFPGYCAESFPGQTCNVVCEFGRNNVPLCQVGVAYHSELVSQFDTFQQDGIYFLV